MKKQALVVIDMQSGLVPGAYREKELVATINDLARRARAAEVPVVFVQHNHATYGPLMRGASGWEIFDALDLAPDDLRVEKEASDAFHETTLAADLLSLGVEEIVVTGLQTEYCVDTTCRAALSKGFDVVLAADAHSTGDALLPAADVVAHHNAVLTNLAHPRFKIRAIPAAEIEFL